MNEENAAKQSGQGPTWEQGVLEKLATAALTEQRKARRWSMLFRFLLLLYLVAILMIYLPADWSGAGVTSDGHTALIDIKGVIADDAEASADNIVQGLRDAFEDEGTKGVILRINSPGGSPVQAGYINDEITRLREKYPDIPVYAVITDMCASGGYYIAVAADKIYADKASIVGSIGVIMQGFGFVETIKKLGIERRLITAGERKAFLDPFSPTNPKDVEHIDNLLKTIHRQFIEVVRAGRGDRLKEGDDMYSGLIWSGEEGVELGLVDELASSGYVAREVIGEETIVDFTARKDLLERFAERIGAGAAQAMARLTGANAAGGLF